MANKQMGCYGTNNTWLLFLILLFVINITSEEFLPSILWDPYHPLFSCTDPTINVKLDYTLRFICPDAGLSSNSDATKDTLYESAYFLNDDQFDDFTNCNATEYKSSLFKCDGQYKSQEIFVKSFAPRPGLPVFEKGKTYYIIGTGYRSQKNVNNLIGGSCSNTTDNAYRLRLKVRVCTDEDVASGKCSICTSQGCYYKSCRISCSDWEAVGNVKRQNQCFHVEKRTCNNSAIQERREEYQETLISCDNQVVTGAATGSDSDEADTYKYVSAIVAGVGLLVGILVGVLCYKSYHSKSCGQKPISPAELESNSKKARYNMGGTINNGFQGDRNSKQMTQS